jgi:hypothetical protein
MKHPFVLLALIGFSACLSSCAFPSRVQWVHTERIIQNAPGVIGPLYVVNKEAIHQYSPKIYTPFVYDHRGLDDNTFYHAQAIRHSAQRKGTVIVGPLTPLAPLAVHTAANPAPAYEVRRATLVR